MKILLSCNDSPHYRDWWPIVKTMWEDFDYEPVLMHVSRKSIFEGQKNVYVIPPSNMCSTNLQSRVARLYGCLKFPGEICVTADIDGFPLKRDFLRNVWKTYNPNEEFMLARKYPQLIIHKEIERYIRVAMQYIWGKSEMWQDLYDCGLETAWEDFLKRFHPKIDSQEYDEITTGTYMTKKNYVMYLPTMLFKRISKHRGLDIEEGVDYVDANVGSVYESYEISKKIWSRVSDTLLPEPPMSQMKML